MGTIDINKYIGTPATVFELHGRAYTFSNKNAGVPCRIKVGPRRFLQERVHPEELKLVLWQTVEGQVDYRPHEPVDVTTEEDGTLFIDAVALARKYFGKGIFYCSSDRWKWNKGRCYSDTFLTTDFGLAQSHSTWLDINVTHSTLRFVPGTLTLCGHDVRRIYWETFCDELGAHSEAVRPVVETLLSAPHTLSAEDVQLAPKLLALLQEEGFNDLTISTDRGVYSLSSSLSPALTITLKDEEPIGGYQPTYDLHPLDRLNLLLELMQADSPDEIRANLEEKRQQGLLRKGK